MYKRLLGLAFSLSLLASCQPSKPSQLKDSVTDLQGETPLEGRSLFDQITMVREGNQVLQKIPFPFEQLRAQLETKLQAPMMATLIPKGRSLQRHATSEPFRYPRVVLAAITEGSAQGENLGFLLKDRLYLGYVEAANQLEAISYNPDMGRFEFQIIDNYGPGLTPRVRYASRAFCLACHQNESPIFSNPSWDETNANPKIQAQLLQAIKSDRYLGIPIRQLSNVPNAIDDATDRANLLIPFQKLWNAGCTLKDEQASQHCRRLSLEMALSYRLYDLFDDSQYAELKTAYEAAWSLAFPKGLKIPQNNIPNFDPFQDFSGKKDTSFLDRLGVEVKGDLERLADDKDIPAEVEPLRERKEPLEIWTTQNEDAARLIFAIAGEFQTADRLFLKGLLPNPADLAQTLDLLEQETPSFFQAGTFTRCRTIAALAQVKARSQPACDFRDFKVMPPAQSTGQASTGDQHDPRLSLFRSYCSQCHGSGPLNFLEGDDATVLQNLANDAKLHIERLSWETSKSRSMPPANSAPRKLLEAAPADREKMIQVLKQLSNPL